MKIRYILATALLMGVSVAQASLVSEWAAGAGVNTNGATVWTDSVSGNILTFNTFNQPGTLVDVSGQSFNSAYLFGGAYPYRAFKSWPSYFGSLTDASVAMWFNVNDLDANYILWSDGAGSGYSISVDTNGAVRGLLKAGANVNDDAMINISGGTVSAGRWYHLAMTIDGANDEVRLYLNGSEIASSTATAFGDFSGTDHTAMGGKNLTKMGGADTDGGGDPTDDVSGFSTLDGQVALVQLYDEALTHSAVASLYVNSVEALQDTSIQAGINEEINYGADTVIALQKGPETDAQSMIYLEFDLGAVSETITNINLSLQSPVDYTNTTPYKLYAVDSASIGPWDESTLTYANAPFTYSNESALASAGLLVAEGTFGVVSSNDIYTVSTPALTGFVSSNTTFTLVLTTTDSTLRAFHSSENGVGAISPRLIINQVSYTPPPPRQPVNILFLGNSFTFRHDLPNLVKTVFEEGHPELDVHVEQVVYGGQNMYKHSTYYFSQTFMEKSTITEEEINSRISQMEAFLDMDTSPEGWDEYYEVVNPTSDIPPFTGIHGSIETAIQRHNTLLTKNSRTHWDYVVLQSWLDVHPSLDEGYAKYARKLADIAESQGTKVILYITAPYIQNSTPVTEPRLQDRVDLETTLAKALENKIPAYCVVPVPLAINMIQDGGTDLTFCYENDFHPNQYCAFLTANMFYAAFFRESTEGFSFDTVTETQVSDGTDPDGGDPVVVFDEPTKLFLQRAAYDAVTAFGTPYTRWSDSFLPESIGSETNDFDGDGFNNLLEYALNGNPTNHAEKGMFSYGSDGSAFTFVHAKNISDSRVSYRLRDRTNLVEGVVRTNTWTSQNVGPVVGDYVTVSNHYEISTDQMFIGLQIQQQ